MTSTADWTPHPATLGGSSVVGATSVTRAPRAVKACTFDRATRECLMSPRMPTWRPSRGRRPSASAARAAGCSVRMVYASRSAWVGCWCHPSPALITAADVQRATCQGTPDERCRTTTASMPIASSVSTVSRRLSPLFTLEEEAENVMVSAESRLAAVSNDSRVRVESSRNNDRTVWPRSAGTFGTGRRQTSTMWSVRSRKPIRSSSDSSSIERRCWRIVAVIGHSLRSRRRRSRLRRGSP